MDQGTTVKNNALEIKEKLWTRNFFLLWQGQLVSALGDVAYEIALGFWVLAVTGSTALMGTLMAASTIPRIVIAPFAGVFVDRTDRRNLIVLADFIRGICIVFIGAAAYLGFVKIWMVFTAGIIMNACAAFFNPAVSSSLPDIVPKSKITKANSTYQMIFTGTNIIGNSAGGFVYQILGAPFMFLFNGISYLFSAFTEIFIKIPKVVKPIEKVSFFTDMKEGYVFVWRFKALRMFAFIASVINFFANMGIVLVLPFFQKFPELGPIKYGIAMAFLTGGMFLGMLFISLVNIPNNKRQQVFLISNFLMTACWIAFPYMGFIIMNALCVIIGFANSIANVMIGSTVQLVVPQNMRGKVFALLSTISSGLTPIAFALGGILAEFISIKLLISMSFIMIVVFTSPLLLMNRLKRFLNFNPDMETFEDIMDI